MRKGNVLFLVLTMLIFCSCAAHRPQVVKDLESQGVEIQQYTQLPGQVIVFQEHDPSGFVVEYGVLRFRSAGKYSNTLEYFDLEKELVFDGKDIMAYYKIDVYNPTGNMLEISYFVEREGGTETVRFSGGNVPNCSYIFYIPIPGRGDIVKSKVQVGLENAPTFVETKQLKCSFAAENFSEKGAN